MKFFHLFFLYAFGASCLSTIAQQASPDPEDHFSGVNARGDQGMGFSHEKTTHHFQTETYQTLILNIRSADTPGPLWDDWISNGFLQRLFGGGRWLNNINSRPSTRGF